MREKCLGTSNLSWGGGGVTDLVKMAALMAVFSWVLNRLNQSRNLLWVYFYFHWSDMWCFFIWASFKFKVQWIHHKYWLSILLLYVHPRFPCFSMVGGILEVKTFLISGPWSDSAAACEWHKACSAWHGTTRPEQIRPQSGHPSLRLSTNVQDERHFTDHNRVCPKTLAGKVTVVCAVPDTLW